MGIDILFEIFASNPPTILLALGGIGWLLCGLTEISIFCDWWGTLILAGIILQIIWLIFKFLT